MTSWRGFRSDKMVSAATIQRARAGHVTAAAPSTSVPTVPVAVRLLRSAVVSLQVARYIVILKQGVVGASLSGDCSTLRRANVAGCT